MDRFCANNFMSVVTNVHINTRKNILFPFPIVKERRKGVGRIPADNFMSAVSVCVVTGIKQANTKNSHPTQILRKRSEWISRQKVPRAVRNSIT